MLQLQKCSGHNVNLEILRFSGRNENKKGGEDSQSYENERCALAELYRPHHAPCSVQ
jgi:hypothetical protein